MQKRSPSTGVAGSDAPRRRGEAQNSIVGAGSPVTQIRSEQEEGATAGTIRVECALGHRTIRLQGIRESAFRDAIVQYAKLRHWLCYFTWNSKHSPAGFPDLVMLREQRMIVAELKVGRNSLTSAQEEWLHAFRWLDKGVEVFIWRPEMWDEIEVILT